MGARGPVPKKNAERRRQNKEAKADTVQVAGVVRVPACPKGAHAIARQWFLSLKASAQAQLYEPSDWAAALVVVEQLTRLLKPQTVVTKDGDVLKVQEPVTGQQFASIWQAMGDLFTTEAARRRARVEVERVGKPQQEAPPPGVSALDAYRERMSKQA